MKFTILFSLLPILAAAAPKPMPGVDELFASGMAKRANELEKRQSTTYNELQSGRCADAIIIYARGTTESGNVGSILSGPLFSNIRSATGNRAIFQGVNDYPADIAGYLAGGSRTGARNMASQVARAATQCSGDKVFNIGYSQGAQVAHLAAALIPTSQYGIVGGFVFFGDPNEGDRLPGALNNNVLTICNDGDLICDGIPLPIGPHLEYAPRAPEAARWIAARV